MRKLPAYRLHRASGRATVTINGRDIYLPGVHGSPDSLIEYEAQIAALVAERELEEHKRRQQLRQRKSDAVRARLLGTKNEVPVVAELVPPYMRHVRETYLKNGRETSQVQLIRASLDVLLRKCGQVLVHDFGPLALKSVRDEFVARGHTRLEINRRCRLIVQCFRWASENEMIDAAVWQRLKSVTPLKRGRTTAPDRPKIPPVSDAHVEATLPHLPPVVAAMVKVQSLSGMRPGEVCTMRAEDIDMSGPVWEYTVPGHKLLHRDVKRVVMLGPKSQQIIREFVRPAIGVHDPCRPAYAHVFPSGDDKNSSYSTTSYRRCVARACRRAGIPPWSVNRLRHSAATRIRKELGLDTARALLGHSDSTTTEIYAEKDLDLARSAMERFG